MAHFGKARSGASKNESTQMYEWPAMLRHSILLAGFDCELISTG